MHASFTFSAVRNALGWRCNWGFDPLEFGGEGAANLLFLSAPDLALVTGCVRVETAVPAEHQHVSGPLIQAFFEIIVSLCW